MKTKSQTELKVVEAKDDSSGACKVKLKDEQDNFLNGSLRKSEESSSSESSRSSSMQSSR